MAKKNGLLCGVATTALMLAALSGNTAQADEGAPGSPFAGFYVGTHIGYGGAEYTGIVSPGLGDPGKLEIEGFLSGVHLGYNWETMSNVLFGIEGDITLTPWGGAKAHPNHNTQFVNGHLSGIASLRGRLGYEFDRTMFYLTGGVAFASSNAVGAHTQHYNDRSRIEVGGVLGGGLEHFLTPNFAIRAEGLYYLFDEKQPSNGSGSGFSGIDGAWMARFGASWYFDNASLFEPVANGHAFRGFYIGGHVGYGSAEYTGIVSPGLGDPGKLRANGFLAGAHVGYNWEATDNVIFGLEADMTLTPWGGSRAHPLLSTVFVSGHLSGIASLRGRLGFVLDHSLAYLTGGIAFASTNATGATTIVFSQRTKIAAGGVFGGGLEFMTGPQTSFRVEGLYYIFDQNKQNGDRPAADGYSGLNDVWVTRVGVSYYFDQAGDADPTPVEANFLGFYFGGHVGYGSAEYSGVASPGLPSSQAEAEGYLAGIHAGYNWQTIHQVLFGVEGDVSLTPWHGIEQPTNGVTNIAGHLNGIASLRGRLGFQFDRSLFYATGGIAFAASNANGGGTVQFNNRTQVEVGPVVGGGIEFMAANNLSLRAEGLYYWFDQNDSGNLNRGRAGIQDTFAVRVGASYYLN